MYRFSIDKILAEKVFTLNLMLSLCIDEVCNDIDVLNNMKIPIPSCNTNFTSITLPGDGTIKSFVEHLGGDIGDSAISAVLELLGLSVIINLFVGVWGCLWVVGGVGCVEGGCRCVGRFKLIL